MRALFLAILVLVASGIPAYAATPNLVNNVYIEGLKDGSISALPSKHQKKDKDALNHERLVDQARDLESVMVSVMVEPMFPKGKESGLYGGGNGNDIYRMMMIQEYGKILSRSNSLGVADNIAKNLEKKEKKND